MTNRPQIELNGVSKMFRLYHKRTDRLMDALMPFRQRHFKDFYALRNIDLKIEQGETLGIIGRNGSGKSTLLKLIAGITQPTSGEIFTRGNVVPLLDMGGGFHPELTGYDNLYYYTTMLGYGPDETKEIVEKVIEFAEIGDFLEQPLKSYSSGMRSRLAFSVSININPEILIVDEVLAVGDEYFKNKCLDKMQELFNSGNTILFVSHAAKDVERLCSRAIMLAKGEKMMDGHTKDVIKFYREYHRQRIN